MNKLEILRVIILFGIISQYKTFICNDDINSEYKEKKEQEMEEDNEENEVRLPLWKDILLIATPVATLVTIIVFGAFVYRIKKRLFNRDENYSGINASLNTYGLQHQQIDENNVVWSNEMIKFRLEDILKQKQAALEGTLDQFRIIWGHSGESFNFIPGESIKALEGARKQLLETKSILQLHQEQLEVHINEISAKIDQIQKQQQMDIEKNEKRQTEEERKIAEENMQQEIIKLENRF